MTIQRPGADDLAMFFNTAIDQQIERLGRNATEKD